MKVKANDEESQKILQAAANGDLKYLRTSDPAVILRARCKSGK